MYVAEGSEPAREELPPVGNAKYWTRRGVAEWLVTKLSEEIPSIVGIDHGFSFPLAYFEKHRVPRDWPAFLNDFHHHWPTDGDHVYVDFVRDAVLGNGAARAGSTRWRRLTEKRSGSAKSLFHFDVPGSVAKSTHAGLPWLRYLRLNVTPAPHFWPFDGWNIPSGRSAVVEVYPRLWNRGPKPAEWTPDQFDAFVVAAQLQEADRDGRLARWLKPALLAQTKEAANIEGWILGVEDKEGESPKAARSTRGNRETGERPRGRLLLRRHALERMAQRNVNVDEVRRILAAGEIIQEYPDDRPLPSRLTLGWGDVRFFGMGWHVSEEEMTCVICKVGETKAGHATVTLERPPTTLVVRGVPAQICANCGEEYIGEEASEHLLTLVSRAAKGGVEIEVRQYEAA